MAEQQITPRTNAEIIDQIRMMRSIADHSAQMRTNHARRLGLEAGIGGDAPFHMAHNAMCAFNHGQPWPGVDYSKVRQIRRIERSVFEASRIVDRWYKRVTDEQRSLRLATVSS